MSSKGKFVPVMLTPFTEKGAIDYNCLAKLTDYYLKAGATGLFANCLSSEMFELTEEERIALTSFVVKEAAGTVPVFSTGTFGGPLKQQADFCRRIYDAGAAAVVATTSILSRENETNEVLLERSHELLQLTGDIPFGFYECPTPYKRVLPANVLKSLVETGRIVYYKDTSLDIHSVKEKIKATAGFPSFELYDAYIVNAVASLKAGCAGLSCIQGNFMPELVSWITTHFADPAYEEQVAEVQQFFVNTMNVMHNVYPITAKYFLQSRGLPIELTTRKSTGNFSASVKKDIDQLAISYEKLQERLGIGKLIHEV
ncbi:MAG: dihydrodipicolinate synthase family protein [Chitinophagaceae bacterium]